MNVRIFTDGACSRNGKKGARASWAYWIPEHKHLSAADFVPENELQTNQRGELSAIFKSVECCKRSFDISQVDLIIYTDSMYSKNCLTTWLPNWIRKDWKNTQGCEVSHRDLIEQLATDLSKFKSYTINHIQAHTGKEDELSKHNEVVDQMATHVLNPDTEVKIVSNKEEFEDLPLKLMGPPMNEKSLIDWCRSNIHKLDEHAVNTALLNALCKTVKTKGFEIKKQKLHRSTMYRIVAKHLITEGTVIVKTE